MKYNLDSGCHSVYSIQFHYICCVKYRRKVFDSKEISERLKEINLNLAEKLDIKILEQETDQDHIHVLFSSKPQIQVSKVINSLKTVSARLLFKEFPEIKKQLWGGSLWSPSYFLASVGEVKLADVKRYVENQGSKDI